MRVLLVEDDRLLGDGIHAGLSQDGYAVDWVQDGRSAEHALRAENYQLAVLDLGLPDIDGLELLKGQRARGMSVPVLILTARDTVQDRVAGLDSGADDYRVKPFDLDELLARLRALQRRSGGNALPLLLHGDLRLDPASHEVYKDGVRVDLSSREFALLHQLLSQRGRVQSRRHIEETLYSWDNEIESNTVEVHIHHLRRKLGKSLIRTIRGVGYVIDLPS